MVIHTDTERNNGRYLFPRYDSLRRLALDDRSGGFWHPGVQFSNPTPKPYKFLSVVYSRNIENLWFAGRNVSMTHAAMSSSRYGNLCSVGPAVSEGCAVAKKYKVTPRLARKFHISEIQQNNGRRLLPAGIFKEILLYAKKRH